MLQREIAVGKEYLTRISGALTRVRVLDVIERESYAGYGHVGKLLAPIVFSWPWGARHE